MLNGAEKQKLMKPLAAEFLNKNIVSIRSLSNLMNLSRDDVTKVGHVLTCFLSIYLYLHIPYYVSICNIL